MKRTTNRRWLRAFKAMDRAIESQILENLRKKLDRQLMEIKQRHG